MTRRFAVYYAAEMGSGLSRTAGEWLAQTEFPGATEDPLRYGFHATLKPPFRMAGGRSEGELMEAVRAFAGGRLAFEAPGLRVSEIGRFIALTLDGECPAFGDLAADCVREFDGFRAPAGAEEVARRKKARLNSRQLAYLDRWGYPYVFEEWQFHMTLTGSLEDGVRERLGGRLRAMFGPFCGRPFVVDAVFVFEQAGEGERFRVVERFPFGRR